jgi:phosphoribosyl-AMP cyclohydrolase
MTNPFPPPGDDVETGARLTPRFNAEGLVAAIAQDAGSGAVLMLAWMNAEALAETLATGRATYWSRSRGRLWRKGEESGHIQRVREVRVDCDQDAILLIVDQTGAACHTGAASCFYRRVEGDGLTRIAEPPTEKP